MRNRRILILVAAIAVALAWLYFVYPAARTPAPARVAAAPTPPPAPPVAATPPVDVPAAPTEPAPADSATRPKRAPESSAAADDAGEPVAPAQTPEPEQETPVTPPADPEKAADLFADQLAKQEAESGENQLPNPARDLWKRFDQEKADDTWSPASTDQLQGSLDEWIDGLPDGTGDHVALVHVECRATLCQILAADNDLANQSSRAEAGQEWQQAIANLQGQPWWSQMGFTDMTTQVTSNDGYVLYTTYLLRRTPPAQ